MPWYYCSGRWAVVYVVHIAGSPSSAFPALHALASPLLLGTQQHTFGTMLVGLCQLCASLVPSSCHSGWWHWERWQWLQHCSCWALVQQFQVASDYKWCLREPCRLRLLVARSLGHQRILIQKTASKVISCVHDQWTCYYPVSFGMFHGDFGTFFQLIPSKLVSVFIHLHSNLLPDSLLANFDWTKQVFLHSVGFQQQLVFFVRPRWWWIGW